MALTCQGYDLCIVMVGSVLRIGAQAQLKFCNTSDCVSPAYVDTGQQVTSIVGDRAYRLDLYCAMEVQYYDKCLCHDTSFDNTATIL